MEQELTSIQNPRVKAIARLHDRSERRERGLCIVEGFPEIATALASGVRVDTLYWCPDLVRGGEGSLVEPCMKTGAQVVKVTPQVMAKMAYREHPDAWLAVIFMADTELGTFEKRSTKCELNSTQPLYVLAEDVEKPGNLGAVLRSADAAGASGFIAAQTRTDLGNPNVIRASKSAVFAMACAEATNEAALAWLRERKVRILAATPSASKVYWDVDMTGPMVIALGAEKEGLSDFWLDQADERVLIPMDGKVNSLNLAQAATLFLYEAKRQRRG